jgi:predicted Zn-dependent protease
MSGLFYNLGKMAGPKMRKAKWIWQSITGNKADTIRIENEVGRDLAREISNQVEFDHNPNTKQILNEIGSHLSEYVANRSRTFSFEIIKDAEPNALALPGGFIFVTNSLVELCSRDQNELAFILGHEMAHVIRGHAMQRIISDSAINIASHSVPIRGQLSGWLRKAGIQFFENAYSQDLESQADKLGVRLIDAAGYNSNASIRLLQRLAEMRSSENQTDLGRYFSSHPPFEVRIRDINHMLLKR